MFKLKIKNLILFSGQEYNIHDNVSFGTKSRVLFDFFIFLIFLISSRYGRAAFIRVNSVFYLNTRGLSRL